MLYIPKAPNTVWGKYEAYSISVQVPGMKLFKSSDTVSCYCIWITILSVRPRSRHANSKFHFLSFQGVYTKKSFLSRKCDLFIRFASNNNKRWFLRSSSSIILFLIQHLFKFSRKARLLGFSKRRKRNFYFDYYFTSTSQDSFRYASSLGTHFEWKASANAKLSFRMKNFLYKNFDSWHFVSESWVMKEFMQF